MPADSSAEWEHVSQCHDVDPCLDAPIYPNLPLTIPGWVIKDGCCQYVSHILFDGFDVDLTVEFTLPDGTIIKRSETGLPEPGQKAYDLKTLQFDLY